MAASIFALSTLLAACGPSNSNGDGAVTDVPTVSSDMPGPATDNPLVDVRQNDVQPFDAGPLPACTAMSMARHIIDRPGALRVADPLSLAATATGFLVTARYVDERDNAADGGVPDAAPRDGGRNVTVIADRSVVIPLAQDGTPSDPITLFEGAPTGSSPGQARLHRTDLGFLAMYEEVRGSASSPDFLLRVHTSILSPSGTLVRDSITRERYSLPDSALINAGLLAVGAQIQSIGMGGLVVAAPVAVLIDSMGNNVRMMDSVLTAVWPQDPFEPKLRRRFDGGALYVFRREGRLGFVPFGADGRVESPMTYEVAGSNVPILEDAVQVGDGVIAAWSRQIAGGTTEVHVTVAGLDYRLRFEQMIESYGAEGPTQVTLVPAYGGAALLWRRGVDARARVRVAVIAPDGTIRVPPTDLVNAPNIEGKLAATVINGREVVFAARDGVRSAMWGYTFGRACIPMM
jgi:hypothetical protein